MARFFVETFGCRCNQADSAMIRDRLARSDCSEAGSYLEADLVVVNTCTVTRRADQQVRQRVRKLHRENPGARLVVTGCYAERDPETLARMDGVDLVVGNADRERIADIVGSPGPGTSGRIVRSPLEDLRDYLVPPAALTGGKTRPFVKIQDGCDARCSYCIVPGVRGPGRSARPEGVVDQVAALVGAGFQEVVLTGIHLGTYGRKQSRRVSLRELLRRILEVPGLGRLRLSSIEPMRFSRGIVSLAASNGKFARHFHVPVQSGSDRILRRMRRPYRAHRFRALIEHLAQEIPEAAIGTDVIVGFPGESEDDFELTRTLLEELPISYLHVFPFSPREGTDAFSFPGRVPPDVLARRARTLRELSLKKNLAFRRRYQGKVLPALTLSKEEREEGAGGSVVLTDNYIHATIPELNMEPNRLIDVQIQRVEANATRALPATEPRPSRPYPTYG